MHAPCTPHARADGICPTNQLVALRPVIILKRMRVLLTGASGFIGSQLLPRLYRDGHAVRVFARDPARLQIPPAWGIEVVQGDVVSGEGLTRALAGVEVAYYLIHSMENASLADFPARERDAATRFANAARRAGVRRIVYLGGPLPAASESPSRHLASRLAVEQTLLQTVPDSLALRASIVIGARSRSFRFMVRLIERMPVLTLPAWRRYRTQPIDARDVTELLAAAAHGPVGGRALDIGGPDTLSYGEMIERIAESMLVNRPTLGLSLTMTPVAARVAAAIAGEDPALTLPLMESLEGDLLMPDAPASAAALNVRLHSFDAAVEHALAEWEASEPLAAR
jgi:uncharacterized protein YbjT (DUF2867 family)